MRLPMPNSKAAQIALCIVLVVLIALVVIFGPLGKKLASLLPSWETPAPQLPTNSGAQPPGMPSGNRASVQPAPVVRNKPANQAVLPRLPVAGNLEELTRLQAEIEEGLLRKKLAELPGKNAMLLTGTASHDARQEAPKPEPVMPVFEPKPTVVSVQGVDGQLSVTLRDRGALATFRTGERCSAGKITRITRDAVVLQGRNGTERLFFE